MRKVQFFAVFWTMVIAIPITVVTISGLAFWTANLTDTSTFLTNINQSFSVGGRGLLVEFSSRWPEVAGMIVGQMVILTIFLFVRNGKTHQTDHVNRD